MSAELLPLIATGVLLLLGLSTLKAGELRRQRSQLVTYRLQFPRQLEVQAATNFLAGLSGLLLPWWRRWLSSPFVVLEVSARKAGVTHQVVVPAVWSRAVEKLLQASTPAIRFERIEGTLPLPSAAAEYRLTSDQRPLRVDARDLALKLLANLQPLRRHEAITVQWVVTPSGPVAPARVTTSEERDWLSISAEPELDVESAAALRKKQSGALLLAVARIGVSSPSTARRRLLLRHVEMAWHGARAPGVHMERRWLPSSVVARRIGHRVVPLAIWPGVYNVDELTGLIGWPLEVVAAPGIVLGGSRQIPPSPQVPRTGTVIGETTYPGSPRPIALDLQARLRHLHVLGPTGTGKSNLLTTIATQDMEAGHGVIVLDAKGDLADDLLDRVPAKRRADVIVLDPADDGRPVGLNPLRAAAGVSAEVVVENLVGTFKSLYRTSWGPRTDDIFRAALLTLAQTGDATLCEVPLLLTDPAYRRRIVGRLDDPSGLEQFWGYYESLSDAEKVAVSGPVLNKVRAVTMRPRIRRIIGQAKPDLSMADVLAQGKILIVPLSPGLLGEEASALLGALVVAELWHAATARAALDPAKRRPVLAVIDEWQRLVHLPTPMASVLAEARSLGLGMVLAHQSLSQLPESARDAVLSNARSRVVFQLPAADARLVARDLGGILTADDLQGLGAYEVSAQVFAAGATQAPATARTLPAGPPSSDGAELRTSSRQRYGANRDDIDTAIRTRQTGSRTNQSPVGRRPKQSPGSKP